MDRSNRKAMQKMSDCVVGRPLCSIN